MIFVTQGEESLFSEKEREKSLKNKKLFEADLTTT